MKTLIIDFSNILICLICVYIVYMIIKYIIYNTISNKNFNFKSLFNFRLPEKPPFIVYFIVIILSSVFGYGLSEFVLHIISETQKSNIIFKL